MLFKLKKDMENSRFILIFFFHLLKLVDLREVIWKTTLGTLVGSVRTSLSGYEYNAFEGIPFAKPPLGELRFKAPRPAGAWIGTLNATQKSPHCYQSLYSPVSPEKVVNHEKESEDCLFLNIYTRNLNKDPTKKIFFTIFGGGYTKGQTDKIGPEYITDEEDVIYINTNYRLNIFGFLSFFDTTLGVPGNAGAKDIIMALQWVHNHITDFGGNPDQITIAGCSNGGQIVNLLMMHPLASKLFRHAISQSGSAITGLVSIELPDYENLAPYLNFTKDVRNNRAFLEHLNNFSGEDLVVAYTRYQIIVDRKNNFRIGQLVIESPVNNPTPFLLDHPDILIAKGAFARMPYLVSFTFQEGGMHDPIAMLITHNYTNLVGQLPILFGRFISGPEIKLLHEKVKRFYYGDEEPSFENNLHALEILSDYTHLYPNLLAWRAMAFVTNFSMPIYMHFFNYTSPLNTVTAETRRLSILEPPYNLTCIHCDEIGYMHDDKQTLSAKYYMDDHETISKLKTYKRIIMNFVRTGIPRSEDLDDPTSKLNWKPIRTKHLLDMEYLAIREPKLELEMLKNSIFADRLVLWSQILKRIKERCVPHLVYLE